MKNTVIVANPFQVTTVINNFNAKVSVNANVVVSLIDQNQQVTSIYFQKNQIFVPDSFGTPGFLRITDVNFPNTGAFKVDVTVSTVQCINITGQPANCSTTIGWKSRYLYRRSIGQGMPSAPSEFFINGSTILSSICCN